MLADGKVVGDPVATTCSAAGDGGCGRRAHGADTLRPRAGRRFRTYPANPVLLDLVRRLTDERAVAVDQFGSEPVLRPADTDGAVEFSVGAEQGRGDRPGSALSFPECHGDTVAGDLLELPTEFVR